MADGKIVMLISSLAVVLLALGLRDSRAESLTCRDEGGKAVDWFIMYKIPLLQDDPSRQLTTGFAYAYLTGPPLSSRNTIVSAFMGRSEEPSEWRLSDHLITDDASILGRTLEPMYAEAGRLSFALYNDQPSTGTSDVRSESEFAPGMPVRHEPLGTCAGCRICRLPVTT